MRAAFLVGLVVAVLCHEGAAAAPAPATPASCTKQMKARGFTTQADAKKFGRACLAAQGATAKTLTRLEVVTLLEPLLGATHPLAATLPVDAATFCPQYAELALKDRALVWRTLLTAMARPESNFQAAEPYWEVDQGQYSIGLLQLSLSDEAGYGCGLKSEADLTRPDVNLACAVKIMTRWVTKDGRIGGDPAYLKLGGARYWSTLRERKTTPPGAPPADARDEVVAAVRALPRCL
ncbi:hypothetical protein CA606_11975 [Caulobacter vibrioides]|uniref:Transglycosylase SLT domain-containing protein n=1 Tax=Caulobacter vibrioides TaxID=155892 RepID=A0A290MLW2_CAUVI|nr:hypothetical protein [Caulobacter vibrioides]ATC32989.1 hypothetical protein CA606_11975 [Caulobacter vibrioides]